MIYRVLADVVLAIHLGFILWVVFGGLAALRWRWLAMLHIPAVIWGVLVELEGWICPLTPLENWLRQAGGGMTHETGFIEHYLVPLIYPDRLTRTMQVALGLAVLVVNLAVYTWLVIQTMRRRGRALDQ